MTVTTADYTNDPFESATDGPSAPAGAPSGWAPKPKVERGKWGWYKLPHPHHPDRPARLWQRASSFAKLTADTHAINLWGKRMVALGLAKRPDLFALAASMTAEQREDLDDVCEQATVAAEANSRANLGTAIHAFTEIVDSGFTPESVPDFVAPDLNAYVNTTRRLGLAFRPEWVEVVTVSLRWDTGGTFDRLVEITKPLNVRLNSGRVVVLRPGDLVIGDLKTGGKAKKTVRGRLVDMEPGEGIALAWQEIEIQLAEYADGAGLWDTATKTWSAMPAGVRKDVGLVFHVPAGSGVCHVLGVDLLAGAEGADLCAAIRQHRKDKTRPAPASLAIELFEDNPDSSDIHVVQLVNLPDRDWPTYFHTARSREELIKMWEECRYASSATLELQTTVRNISARLP